MSLENIKNVEKFQITSGRLTKKVLFSGVDKYRQRKEMDVENTRRTC
jgi:hypothetical protein